MIRKNSLLNQLTFFIVLLTISIASISFLVKDSLATESSPISGGGLDSNSYYYSDWNQNMTVNMDGSLTIVEEMTFRLSPGSYGYAYRNVKWRKFDDIKSWGVQSGTGTPEINHYMMDKSSDYIEFYWEWPRTYFPSTTDLTFILNYTATSAMDLRGGRDRVYWNVIGGEFEVSIQDIDTRVILPKIFNHNDVRHVTYYEGSGAGDELGFVSDVGGHTVVDFHQNTVGAYESYTIDVDTPSAGINMPFSWRVYLNSNWILPLAIGFLPLFLFFMGSFLIQGLDPRPKVVPTLNEVRINKCQQCGFRDARKVKFCSLCGAEMAIINEIGPPNNLSPAEVGTLLDEKFDQIDFVAEFFYLSEQGYLRIIQMPDSDEIYFQRTEKSHQYGALSMFDRSLLDFIEEKSYESVWFEDSNVEGGELPVDVTSLSTIKLNVASLWKHKKTIYEKLSGGETNYFAQNPEKVRGRFFGLAIVLGIVGSVALWGLSELLYIHNLMIGIIGVIVASSIGLLLSKFMPKLTKEGAKVKASWQSYMQIIRGKMLGFPDPYEQFSFSMDHFSYLLVNPKFDLPRHLRHISRKVSQHPPPRSYRYIAPYWYYYPGIYYPSSRGVTRRSISGFESFGKGFESVVDGISTIAESLPTAISNMAEGLTSAISNMSQSLTPPSSSGGTSGFGGGFSGGGGGGGGGGIG